MFFLVIRNSSNKRRIGGGGGGRRLLEGGAYLSKYGILYVNRDALEFGGNEDLMNF